MTVKVERIDVIAEEDVYRRGGEYMTYTELYINPDSRRCLVSQQSNAPGVGTPEDEWHHRVLTYNIGGGREFGRGECQAAPDADDLRKLLESKKGQALLDRICDGHEVNWDGHNRVGELDSDAQAAREKLMVLVDDLPRSQWTTWMIEDWLYEWRRNEVKATTTDAEIVKLAQEAKTQADDEYVYVDGDIEDYLTEYRDELKKEMEDA